MKKTVPVLQKKYKEEIAPHLMKTFGYKNVMQVPGSLKLH